MRRPGVGETGETSRDRGPQSARPDSAHGHAQRAGAVLSLLREMTKLHTPVYTTDREFSKSSTTNGLISDISRHYTPMPRG